MKFPLLNFEVGPGVPLFNFEGGPGVPLVNSRGGGRVPLLNFWGGGVPGLGSRVPGSLGPGSHSFTMPIYVTFK